MAQPTFIDTCLPNGDVQRVNTQIIPAATYAKAVANFVNNPGNPNSAPFPCGVTTSSYTIGFCGCTTYGKP